MTSQVDRTVTVIRKLTLTASLFLIELRYHSSLRMMTLCGFVLTKNSARENFLVTDKSGENTEWRSNRAAKKGVHTSAQTAPLLIFF